MAERECNMQGGPPIPWYLAEAIHKLYVECFGNIQSLERINERGGFGYDEIKHLAERRQKNLKCEGK
jgi:hypothetical protein